MQTRYDDIDMPGNLALMIPRYDKCARQDDWSAISERKKLDDAMGWPVDEVDRSFGSGTGRFQITTYRVYRALHQLREYIDIDPLKRGGVPVLRGTRFKLSQFFAQLADGDDVDSLSDNLNLDGELLKNLLFSISVIVDRPAVHEHHSIG